MELNDKLVLAKIKKIIYILYSFKISSFSSFLLAKFKVITYIFDIIYIKGNSPFFISSLFINGLLVLLLIFKLLLFILLILRLLFLLFKLHKNKILSKKVSDFLCDKIFSSKYLSSL